MKNEMVGAKQMEGKAGLSAVALPWWAKVLIAQHVESSFPVSGSHHVHHCSYRNREASDRSDKIQPLQGGN